MARVGGDVETLEMFFSGLPRLINMKAFPNLIKLVIANQAIERIEGLDSCVNLQELWITECKLKVCVRKRERTNDRWFYLRISNRY